MDSLVTDSLVVVEVLDGHGRVAHRHRLQLPASGLPITIGRAISCDVILDDSHVAAHHASLRVDTNGAVHVSDLASVNGITLNGKHAHGVSDALLEDPELQLGRTRLRIRIGAETLAPEKPDPESWRRGPLLWVMSIAAVVVYAYAAFEQWLPAPDNLTPAIGEEWLSQTALLAFWISGWTLLGRINSGEWRWMLNTAICLVALAVSELGSRLINLLVFAFQGTHGPALALMGAALLVAATGYAQLRAVTRVQPQRLAIIVALITCVSFGGTYWFSSQRLARNVDNVDSFETIFPPALRLVQGSDPELLFRRAGDLRKDADEKRKVALTQEP